MYKILLVDDDPIVLTQIRQMIDWKGMDCELLAEASSGAEAIRMIEKLLPEIVITDINMPGINGTDLIRYIGKFGNSIQTIAISAFDDFQYVRDSLKEGAGDYLLKHQMTKESLEQAIRTAIRALDARRHNAAGFSAWEKREHLTYLLLNDKVTPEETALIQELQLGWLEKSIIPVVGEIDPGGEAANEDAIRIFMEETIKYYQDYFIAVPGKGEFLLIFPAEGKDIQEITGIAEQIQKNIRRFCDVGLSFVICDFLDSYGGIRDSVRKAEDILREQYFYGKKSFLLQVGRKVNPQVYRWGLDQERKLLQSLENGGDMERVFDEIFMEMEKELYSKSQMQVFYVEIMAFFQRGLEKYRIPEESILNGSNPYEKYSEIETFLELKEYLTEIFRQLQAKIVKQKEKSAWNEIVRKTISYIEQHYGEKISLTDLSVQLAVSSSYLSRVFKKCTGMNIVNYINQVKMEKARELIAAGEYSLEDIAYRVGISNYNYFYMLFKKFYGVSPSDYIKNSQNMGNNRTKILESR